VIFGGAPCRFFFPCSSMNHDVATECLEAWRYICNSPGKNIRSVLIDCFQQWMEISDEEVEAIKVIVGYLHNASLLVDDIEDDSKLRRGKPVAHLVYGIPQTLNCANYVYFLAMEKCMALGSNESLTVFTKELLNLHRGQGRELYWREHNLCPTEEQYLCMVKDKTGGLFRLACGLMQSFSLNTSDFFPLCDSISVYFQVRDDFINLASEEYHVNKSYCEDLSEGKYSFPIIHAIKESAPDDTRVISILKQRTENVELKASVVEMLRKETKSFQYTRDYLGEIHRNVLSQIEQLGGCPPLVEIMNKLNEDVDRCPCD